MSRKKKSRKKTPTRQNQTAHRIAMESPRNRNLVSELRRSWDQVDRIVRGDTLCELIARGCSRRGLAKELGQSPTTIRRHVYLASMPDEYRFYVQNGASAKKTLAIKARADMLNRMRERIIEERKSGKYSDEIADLILNFCRGDEGVPETPLYKVHVHQLLNEVESYLNRFATFGRSLPRTSKKRGLKVLFETMRPPVVKFRLDLDHRAEWLAKVIWARCKEKPIREHGIEKALKRAGELEVKKTPLETLKEKYLASIVKGFDPRPFQP